MEANRWYMCIKGYSFEKGISFKIGKIYFFEKGDNYIYTIDEHGDKFDFHIRFNKALFYLLFRIATNEEIYKPNQVVFKEKVNMESQVLTKREQIAAMIQISHKERLSQWDLIIMTRSSFPVDEKQQLAWFIEAEAKYKVMKADALIKALES